MSEDAQVFLSGLLLVLIGAFLGQVIFGPKRIEAEILSKHADYIVIRDKDGDIETEKAFEYTLKTVEIGKKYLLIKSQGAISVAKELVNVESK